jgi:hypothetical protein
MLIETTVRDVETANDVNAVVDDHDDHLLVDANSSNSVSSSSCSGSARDDVDGDGVDDRATTTLLLSSDALVNVCQSTLGVSAANSLRSCDALATLLLRSATTTSLRTRSIASLLLKCIVVQSLAGDASTFGALRAWVDVCLEADASVVQTLLITYNDRAVRCELIEAAALLHQTALFRHLTLHCVAKRIRPQWRFAALVYRRALRMPCDLMSALLTHFGWRFRRLVNESNGRDQPSLHEAQSIDMVRLLVAHGANVNIRSLSGGSVLHTALDQRPVDLALLTALLHYGYAFKQSRCRT